MLTIRNKQLEAIAEIDLRGFREMLAGILGRKYPDAVRGLPKTYLDQLITVAAATCRKNGYDRQGTVIDFAESLLRDDPHPMKSEDLARKAERVLRELRSSEIFHKLQAAKAAAVPPQE